MGLFELTGDSLKAVPTTTFAAEGVLERRDLQRVLLDNLGAIDDALPVVAEEFGKWFLAHPVRDADRTWVLSKMWGRQTVPTLDKLVALAPREGFSYRAG